MSWVLIVIGGFAIFDAFEGEGDSLTQKEQWQAGVAVACILIGALMAIFEKD